jgi:adenosylmethionine---8-amino-7-oxononanoate aminotransferase
MKKLRDIDLAHVWHPFTQMQDFSRDEDLIIVRACGNHLYDDAGGRYYDATSSLWVSAQGHRHPALNAAIRHQLGKVAHSTLLGIGNEPAALLAEKLAGMTPGLNRVFYSDNGSTAAEVSLKMAFQYWRHKGATGSERSRFVALKNGYHGDTVGSVSVGGMDLFHSIFSPLLFHTHFAPSPNCYRCPMGCSRDSCRFECVEAMDAILEEQGDEIAAVLVEPMVQGAGGIVIYPPEVLKGYEQAARKHGVLFIVDEVATGFGRTGRMFACDHANVKPDLMAVAKGLTGGYLPLAATLVADHIYEAFLADWKEFKTFFHGHTFTGNPLGCAAALANLELVSQIDYIDDIQQVSGHFASCLERLRDNPHVGDLRLLGMIGGVELVADKATAKPFPVESRIGHHVCLAARKAGILARPLGDIIVLMPPLSSTPEEVNHFVDAIEYGIDSVLSDVGMPIPKPVIRTAEKYGVIHEVRHVRRPHSTRRLFVTGTDTGVGKTAVVLALAAAAQEMGLTVKACKPIESGVTNPDSGATDRARLAAMTTIRCEHPCFNFSAPLSPNIAARLEHTQVDVTSLGERWRTAGSPEGIHLIEGAGGLLVPVTDGWTFADLAREGNLPVLIVVGDKLGCLNHTLLTVRTANELGLEVGGVILHPLDPFPKEEAQHHNEAELRRLLGDLFLGVLPYVADVDDKTEWAAAGKRLARKLWA